MFKRMGHLLFHGMLLPVHNAINVFQVEPIINNHCVNDYLRIGKTIHHTLPWAGILRGSVDYHFYGFCKCNTEFFKNTSMAI